MYGSVSSLIVPQFSHRLYLLPFLADSPSSSQLWRHCLMLTSSARCSIKHEETANTHYTLANPESEHRFLNKNMYYKEQPTPNQTNRICAPKLQKSCAPNQNRSSRTMAIVTQTENSIVTQIRQVSRKLLFKQKNLLLFKSDQTKTTMNE
jgi:hypothetical protein